MAGQSDFGWGFGRDVEPDTGRVGGALLMRRTTLNATAASLLGFLHERPMTGWDLVAVAQRRIGGFWTLTQSQVYRELTAMAGAGLVEAGPPGPRDRKPYTITAEGRAAFRDWISREPGLEQIRFPLLVTLAFADHVPAGQLAAVIEKHRAIHEERLSGYEQAQAELPGAGASRATLEFGVRYERAVLDWFERLPEILGEKPAEDS
jgi:DNA-binding PadR family transcriptional regulator